MTTAAWIMMISTWSVILFFTVRYFLLVLKKSADGGGEDQS